MFIIRTERVGLRKFQNDDLDDFAALNSDAEVMRFFPGILTKQECLAYIDRINAKIDEQGFGFWAAEHLDSGRLMGFVGLTRVSYETEFTPAVEIGWRLAREFWGQGLATEAADACLEFAFRTLDLDEVVSFTVAANTRSYHVMERIGMKKSGHFNHPKIETGNELERHVLYRISRSDFLNAQK